MKDNIKKKKWIMPLFIIGLSILLSLRDIGGVDINKFIYLIYIVLFLALSNYEETIYVICFSLPLLNGLPATYIMLFMNLFLIVRQSTITRKTVGFVSFFVILEIIASFFYPSADYIEIAGYSFAIFIFFFLMYENLSCEYAECIKYYYIGICVFFAIVVVSNFMSAPDNWATMFSKGWFRIGNVSTIGSNVMKLGVNPNEVGYYSVIGFFLGLTLQKIYGKRLFVLRMASMLFIFICGLLSLSRSFVVVLLVFIVIYMLANMKSIKRFAISISLMAILAVFLYLFLDKNPQLLEGFVYRFTAEDMAGGNGRISGIQKHLTAFFNNPRGLFFGVGVTQSSQVFGISGTAHNMLVQTLESFGIIGFIVYLAGMLKPAIIELRNKPEIEYVLPVLAILLYAQIIPFINPYTLMLHYLMGIFALRVKESFEDLGQISRNI